MKNLPQVINKALNLLRRSPDGAALTVALGGGGDDFYMARIEPYMRDVIIASGRIRPTQTRPAVDLRLYVESGKEGEGYSAHIERVTGMGALASIPDPTDFVASVKAATLDELEVGIVAALEEKIKVDELTLTSCSYRKNKFSAAKFTVKEVKRSPFNFWSPAPTDSELVNFVADTVGDALRFDGGYEASSISLWFTLGECMKTIYVTIALQKNGKFTVSAEDRVCWPWKEKAINKTVSTRADVCQIVADYIGGSYSFRISDATVYFNWS